MADDLDDLMLLGESADDADVAVRVMQVKHENETLPDAAKLHRVAISSASTAPSARSEIDDRQDDTSSLADRDCVCFIFCLATLSTQVFKFFGLKELLLLCFYW